MAARNFIILSLGQLTKADLRNSIKAFTTLSVDQSKLPHFLAYPLYFFRTLAVYGWDMFVGKNIENYKLGKIKTPEFMEFLKSKFAGIDDGLLIKAWNAMCVIDERSIEDIKTVITLQSQDLVVERDVNTSVRHNVVPVVVSATNPLHFEFIKEQVKTKLPDKEEALHRLFASITKSYDEGNLNQTALANTALAKLTPTQGTDKIMSLHWGIAPQNCSWRFRFNPEHADLMQVIKSIANHFDEGTVARA